MKGLDCATPFTTDLARLFAADGFTHICRYLVPGGYKHLTRQEAEIISNAGLKIVSVFETVANRCQGGQSTGTEDGKSALQCALAVGQTLGTAIYFAVDFDAKPNDLVAIEAYLKAAALEIKGYEVGVYGSFAVVEAMKVRGIKYLWQTIAWSHGFKSSSANIYQFDCGNDGNGLSMHGIGVDLDEINLNEGGWDTMQIPVLDASKIIQLISSAYLATNDPVARAEYHRLANVMRTASNQQTT